MDVKTEALLAVAKAYHARGKFLQYDQRSMDRVLQLTPRPRKNLPPEAATEGNTTYLDCSGFVNACFYQAFGVELEADLTWHMIDYVKPRVYYYEITHRETEDELAALEQEIRTLLQPGDVMTFDRGVGSGHTMLYLGDGMYTDCTPNGRPDSYDFENKKSREYESGGIWVHPITRWFDKDDRNWLFAEKKRRLCIQRPLDVMPEPTKQAMARIGDAKDLLCGVEVSHPGGIHAVPGETVTYTVFVKNLAAETKSAEVSFCGETACLQLAAGERKTADFSVTAPQTDALWMEPPKVTVNTLEVCAPCVLLGKRKYDGDAAAVAKEILTGKSAVAAACGKTELQKFYQAFYLHDSVVGDVLSRKAQNPGYDGIVYAMYGGKGVITPEFATRDGVRCMKIRSRDIMAGDVVLCCDDAHGESLYSCFCTGDSLVGKFEHAEEAKTVTGEELTAFVDSLFGRFCFAVLRPCLQESFE